MKMRPLSFLSVLIVTFFLVSAAHGQAKALQIVRGKKLVVTGNVRDGNDRIYMFKAREGQRLTVKLTGPDTAFSLFGGATDAEDIATETQSWSGKLTEPDEDGMYLLRLTSLYKVATFRLEILLQ
jgi:hypothetical protein